jgi:hypothetical protein
MVWVYVSLTLGLCTQLDVYSGSLSLSAFTKAADPCRFIDTIVPHTILILSHVPGLN